MVRALALLVLACAVAQIGAAPATGDADLRASVAYLGRADPRMCPSPMCGGLWLKAVNGASGNCSRPSGAECYVTGLEFRTGVDETRKSRLTLLVTTGGGLVEGWMTRAPVDGFPDLRALLVNKVWRAASKREPAGAFRVLVDNRIRCVKSPCYSIAAGALNTGREATVSGIDLRRTGASAEERRWAQSLVARRGLIAAGRIVRAPDGGRTFVATQLYLPTR